MREIISKAWASLAEEKFWFIVMPAILALAVGCLTWFSDSEVKVFADVIGSIGIFSALMFSVIFIVVEHFLKRRMDYNSDNEEDKRYIQNYQKFTKEVVTRISFSIFLAGLIIVLAFILPQLPFTNKWYLAIRNTVFVFLLLQYAGLIIIVVKDMYAMLMDDTEQKK